MVAREEAEKAAAEAEEKAKKEFELLGDHQKWPVFGCAAFAFVHKENREDALDEETSFCFLFSPETDKRRNRIFRVFDGVRIGVEVTSRG